MQWFVLYLLDGQHVFFDAFMWAFILVCLVQTVRFMFGSVPADRFCGHCGQEHLPTDTFCYQCGTELKTGG